MEALSGASRIAIDIEANSLHHYFQKVCLIQLSAAGENYIVDPLCGVEVAPLLELLAETPLIFHAGDYDLRMLRMSYNFAPKAPVFDTMLAAQLLGRDELGLVAAAQRYLDIPLTKHSQKSNWARRPLSEKQLGYACDDTRYLEALSDKMVKELESKGRLRWHVEACRRMVESSAREAEKDPDEVWRIKGSGLLEPQELVYLQHFWHWRDKEARKADVPPFKVAGNSMLIDLAKWAAKHPDAPLSDSSCLARSVKGRRFNLLDAALKKARSLPKAQWPRHKRRGKREQADMEFRRRVETLQAACAVVAESLQMAPSVLASRATLADIARHRPATANEMLQCSGLMQWQAELLEDPLRDILNHRDGENGPLGDGLPADGRTKK